ncbi:hypothetical protein FAM09_30240 [Niastella caeni]|uniref:Sulfatase N-terminal domain-containing protein n=1 Tax=Niastella caeni TaxID=2569763 RepID=A0A4S8H8W3_9BACT|nr:sulfatase-like hydrolase/transferase [Niastella caeni]THU30439.1 hypothetical protein FAM09_30240 [Niastella caeni]
MNNTITRKYFPLFQKLSSSPVYLYPFLIVLYFVLHECNANFGLIPVPFSVWFAFCYLFVTLVIFLLASWYFNKATKSLLFTALIVIILLFFGAMHDFVKKLSVPDLFKQYRFWLPFLSAIVIGSIIFLRKSAKEFLSLNRYLFITFGVLCIWELLHLGFNVVSKENKNNILFADTSFDKKLHPAYDSTQSSPSIYFIILDAFTSSSCLKKEFNYDNAGLDSFLTGKGFYIVTNSKSNYPVTPYSIASFLNFSYLKDEVTAQEMTARDRIRGGTSVGANRLVPYLERKGYNIFNYSIFNLNGHPVQGADYFYSLKQRMLSGQTLLGRIQRDIFWNVRTFIGQSPKEYHKQMVKHSNDYIYDKLNGLKAAAGYPSTKPKFVYCHLMLPHGPYIFHRDGTFVQDSEQKPADEKKAYLDQLIFARQLLKSAINTIFKKDTLNKIIVVAGDHGFRDYGTSDKIPQTFENLHAIYFYDKNYQSLHDSLTPVNTFRIVLNQYFQEHLVPLRDTSIFVYDPF